MHLVCRTFSRWWEDERESVSHSVVSDSATAWAVACQAPLSMEFSRQEYWSGFPFIYREESKMVKLMEGEGRMVVAREAWHVAVHGVSKSRT